MRELSPDFRDLLDQFRAEEVEYLIVGGYAVGFHGHPRYTADLDVWVARRAENMERLSRALKAFGTPLDSEDVAALAVENSAIGFGAPPFQVHLLNFLAGCDWDEAFARGEWLKVEENLVHVLSLEDLMKSKAFVGRLQDLADLEKLRKIHRLSPKSSE